MELVWLEDFLALAEHGSFVRAAEARHITQPAFSRRIRALERWMDVELFCRTPLGTRLTPAGEQMRLHAAEAVNRLYRLRQDAQAVAGKAARTLPFAATHSLSFTFFPRWIRQQEQGAPIEAIQLHSDSMAVCERMLEEGQVAFMLSHVDPMQTQVRYPATQTSTTDGARFVSQKIGQDVLLPLIGAGLKNTPITAYLAYTEASGLGRIVNAHLQVKNATAALPPVRFESHLAAVLMSMVLENKGLAWLPKSLAEQELADGRLVVAEAGLAPIEVEVHLTRSQEALSPFAEAFWTRLGEENDKKCANVKKIVEEP